MLKQILAEVIFTIVTLGGIILYMLRVYGGIDARARRWLGQRLGVEIIKPHRRGQSGWTVAGKHTSWYSFIVFLAELGFVATVFIIPIIGWFGVGVALFTTLGF